MQKDDDAPRAEVYRARAEEYRVLADNALHAVSRQTYLDLADTWDQAARFAEQRNAKAVAASAATGAAPVTLANGRQTPVEGAASGDHRLQVDPAPARKAENGSKSARPASGAADRGARVRMRSGSGRQGSAR